LPESHVKRSTPNVPPGGGLRPPPPDLQKEASRPNQNTEKNTPEERSKFSISERKNFPSQRVVGNEFNKNDTNGFSLNPVFPMC